MIYYKISLDLWVSIDSQSWELITCPNTDWCFLFEPGTKNRVCVYPHISSASNAYGVAVLIGGSQDVMDDFKTWVDDWSTEEQIASNNVGWEELTSYVPYYPDTAWADGVEFVIKKPWEIDGRPVWACRSSLAGVV